VNAEQERERSERAEAALAKARAAGRIQLLQEFPGLEVSGTEDLEARSAEQLEELLTRLNAVRASSAP